MKPAATIRLAAIDDPRTYGQTYNLASGRKTLVRQLVAELISAWGCDPDSYPVEQGERTPGDQFGIYADISLLSNALGWEPRVPLSEGLGRMAGWAKDSALSGAESG